jgi:hypothetical protein
MLKSGPITSKKTSTEQCRVISLQEKIKVKLGYNFELVLDVKTPRNSLANMISMFLKLFKSNSLRRLYWSSTAHTCLILSILKCTMYSSQQNWQLKFKVVTIPRFIQQALRWSTCKKILPIQQVIHRVKY